MKKSRMVLLFAVVAIVMLSCTTAFAKSSYGGYFLNGYTTSEDCYVSTNGSITMDNYWARYEYPVGCAWNDGASYKTTALKDGGSFEAIQTYSTTDYVFNWSGSRGRGKLKFDNDYTWTRYQLWNAGEFY